MSISVDVVVDLDAAGRGGGRDEDLGALPSLASESPPCAPSAESIPRPSFCSSASPLSVGSIGHPTLCNSACVHAQAGTSCPRGHVCTWCHDPHCTRRKYLDKRNRILLRKVDDFTKIAIVWPILTTKVDELGLGSAATQALEKWHSDVMSMPQFAGLPQLAGLARLYPHDRYVEGLRRLRLIDLCACPILPDGVLERTERLLMELRTFAACKLMTVAPTALDHD